jgi:hypothetical protein
MSSDLGMMEPSPFDPDDPGVEPSRSWEPARPMSQRELDLWLSMPIETRVYDAYRCMFNLMAEDGIGMGSGMVKQCKTRIYDPTKSRYCVDHAAMLDVEYYSPGEFSEISAGEASANLTRLVPKAVRTLELVMEDADAPPGIRAKAADSVLDRTGFAKGVDVRMDAKVAVVDITSVIRERLEALRDAALGPATAPGSGPPPPDEPAPEHRHGAPGARPPLVLKPVTSETVPGTVLPESPLSAESFADEKIPEDPPFPPDDSPVS